ncbi:MAG: hypothetical protein OIF40_10945 [Mangrovicoccus sp.]|nr:hypothetical protein [Mangrovicoccus sp.]
MADTGNSDDLQALGALFKPLARLMIELGIPLRDGLEVLKLALVDSAYERAPDASASHVSLLTGVHRKDLKRFEQAPPPPRQTVAAAKVLTLWQNDSDFLDGDAPRALPRGGDHGFDALVRRAKVDAAPATVLSVLQTAGAVADRNGLITFLTATLVPEGRAEKLQVALATLVPHLQTAIGNVAGDAAQWDQALRYSHLSKDAARQIEAEAARLSLDMLKTLNELAFRLQNEEEGTHLFVAGTFTHVEDQSS